MTSRIDISGQKFGRLTAMRYVGERKWRCVCECGVEKDFYTGNLKRGLSQSCGCLNRETQVARWSEYEPTFDPKSYAKAYAERNKETLKERQKAYREANKEKLSDRKRRCYEAKRDKYLSRVKANYAADPEAAISRERRKTTLRHEATPPWVDKVAVKELYREARRLTKETGTKYHVDHIVPLRSKVVCGLHWEGNMRVITASENWKKRNKLH